MFTVNVAVWIVVPLVPITVMVYVPASVVLVVPMTSVDEFDPLGVRLKVGREEMVMPLGATTVRVTVPAKPARLVKVTVVEDDCPTSKANTGGFSVMLKSGPVTITTNSRERDMLPLRPVMVRV
jgi:hypothetical protein